MAISTFELFSIGIGPSSSHTVGPMRASNCFLKSLQEQGLLSQTHQIKIELYGSLALTGHGHATDFAVILGLEGCEPKTIDPVLSRDRFSSIKLQKQLNLAGQKTINFSYDTDLIWHKDKLLPFHANGMQIIALDQQQNQLLHRIYYSIGGGFIVDQETFNQTQVSNEKTVPYPFNTAMELLALCTKHNLTIAQLMIENELTWRTKQQIQEEILQIWEVMDKAITRGMHTTGTLPGGLDIPRRAPQLFAKLQTKETNAMDWLSLYAIAVNEENAAGGRIVTAPTNGAAGIIPSVLKYCITQQGNNPEMILEFLLTAAAIGILYKERASISAAEVGCQGEVGVACSMAAAAYTAVQGGTIMQIENAAEIGMEHHLGLTCDPVGGLVQIPCIERNAMGSVQAINSAQLALLGDGNHYISLDRVIATMRQTGKDMMSKYKETSLGGLAVNLPEC